MKKNGSPAYLYSCLFIIVVAIVFSFLFRISSGRESLTAAPSLGLAFVIVGVLVSASLMVNQRFGTSISFGKRSRDPSDFQRVRSLEQEETAKRLLWSSRIAAVVVMVTLLFALPQLAVRGDIPDSLWIQGSILIAAGAVVVSFIKLHIFWFVVRPRVKRRSQRVVPETPSADSSKVPEEGQHILDRVEALGFFRLGCQILPMVGSTRPALQTVLKDSSGRILVEVVTSPGMLVTCNFMSYSRDQAMILTLFPSRIKVHHTKHRVQTSDRSISEALQRHREQIQRFEQEGSVLVTIADWDDFLSHQAGQEDLALLIQESSLLWEAGFQIQIILVAIGVALVSTVLLSGLSVTGLVCVAPCVLMLIIFSAGGLLRVRHILKLYPGDLATTH